MPAPWYAQVGQEWVWKTPVQNQEPTQSVRASQINFDLWSSLTFLRPEVDVIVFTFSPSSFIQTSGGKNGSLVFTRRCNFASFAEDWLWIGYVMYWCLVPASRSGILQGVSLKPPRARQRVHQKPGVSRLGLVARRSAGKAEGCRFDSTLRLTFPLKKCDLWTLSGDFSLHN